MDDERLALIEAIRDSAAAVAPRDGDLARIRALRFAEPGFDPATWRRMAEMGWIGLALPEARGGAGMGMPESVALQEELGRGLVPEPLIVGALAARTLALTDESDLLERVLAGEALVAVAWQGTADAIEAGTDPAAPRPFVPFAGAAEAYLVPVAEGEATRLRLVPAEAAAVTVLGRQDGGFAGTVTVPADAGRAVSGDVGAGLARALDEAALETAAYLLGLSERAFAITLAYLKERRQFDQPLAAFQALQHRAADMQIQLTLARASIEGAAWDLDQGAPAARAAVSRAKARAADTALLVARESLQMHGAIGWADECDIGLFVRKALVVANQHGSALAHRQRFAALADAE